MIELGQAYVSSIVDPLGEAMPFYRVRYGELWREVTPSTSDREQAEAWARWAQMWLAQRVEWEDRPWLAKERQAEAWRREWNDGAEDYIGADGNRYSDQDAHDFYWQQEGK